MVAVKPAVAVYILKVTPSRNPAPVTEADAVMVATALAVGLNDGDTGDLLVDGVSVADMGDALIDEVGVADGWPCGFGQAYVAPLRSVK